MEGRTLGSWGTQEFQVRGTEVGLGEWIAGKNLNNQQQPIPHSQLVEITRTIMVKV